MCRFLSISTAPRTWSVLMSGEMESLFTLCAFFCSFHSATHKSDLCGSMSSSSSIAFDRIVAADLRFAYRYWPIGWETASRLQMNERVLLKTRKENLGSSVFLQGHLPQSERCRPFAKEVQIAAVCEQFVHVTESFEGAEEPVRRAFNKAVIKIFAQIYHKRRVCILN